MAVADDVLAEVAKLKTAVDLAVALIGNLKGEINTAGMTVEQAQGVLSAVQAVEATLNGAVSPTPPAAPAPAA